jgi:hypothetical protein
MKEKLTILLKKLDEAYNSSDNKYSEYCIQNNKKWGYELIQTALIPSQPLVIGFNWGVDNNWQEYTSGKAYQHQVVIEKQKMMDIYKGSLQRAVNLIGEYFPKVNMDNSSHSNFCFFRSENEKQITPKDIDLCIPIFNKLISILEPSVIFCFSSKARDYMRNSKIVNNYEEKYIKSSQTGIHPFKAAKGIINDIVPVYYLPHPMSRLTTDVRTAAWEFCSK